MGKKPYEKSKPSMSSEPDIVSKPNTSSEPTTPSNPAIRSEPETNTTTWETSESYFDSKPLDQNEPILSSKPKKRSTVRRPLGRLLTNFYYNSQDIRLKFMNNIRDIIRKVNENIAFDEVEEKKEAKSYDKQYNDSNIPTLINNLLLDDKLSKEDVEYLYKCMDIIKGLPINKMVQCKHCERRFKMEIQSGGVIETENQASKLISQFIKKEPIYNIFLSKVRGIGPILVANLVKSFGYCEKANTVSQLWAYTGNHVVNGKAPKREKGKKLGFNNALKTLTWKISDSLMKGNKGYYRGLYDSEKEKQLTREYPKGELAKDFNGYKEEDIHISKGHAHNRALRKVRKHFLAHYWECARELIGLPIDKIYVEGVMKHEHIIHWREVLERE